ncbi:MAG: hypothetical protein PHO37_10595 [Kiritimatiellae bacterium]|nr:hypothetical protein [Kiritimatiellia bacterium]
MKKTALLLALALFSVGTLRAERFVFDMPEAHALHLQLLAMMNDAHARKDYYAMEALTHQGVALGTADSLWTYNQACALALQDNRDEAIDRLQEAIDLGFDDLEHIQADSDLDGLRTMSKFIASIIALQAKLSAPGYTNTALRKIIALPPDAHHNVYQAATNTIWSFSTGLFHTLMSRPLTSPTHTPPFIIYVNRDNDDTVVDTEKYPGVMRLQYAADVKERNLHLGQPNTLFVDQASKSLIPAVGNSSMGFVTSSYWRCQPRALFLDPFRIHTQIAVLMSNQIYCYPTYNDYNLATGDLFPANTPYYIAVAGAKKSEKIFAEAMIAALAAMRGETLEHLARTGLVAPTLQVLLRKSQRTVTAPGDYLTGIAHPTAFQPDQLDLEQLLSNAHALTPTNIPPLLFIAVEDRSELDPVRDMPNRLFSEELFTTHLAVARIFRGFPFKRRLSVTTSCNDEHAEIRPVILQGDPRKITITKSTEDEAAWIVEFSHHDPYMTPVADGKSILTCRIDIGFFAEKENSVSMPALLSCTFPGNEKREYDESGKLLSIDYRRYTFPDTDPALSYPCNWRDDFKHDPQGRIIGWTRTRVLKKEQFTAYGDLAVEFDRKGRPTLAHRITYVPRFVSEIEQEGDSPPSLAQVDDKIEVHYSYASDDDLIGTPDR